jgi:hypothetical protein
MPSPLRSVDRYFWFLSLEASDASAECREQMCRSLSGVTRQTYVDQAFLTKVARKEGGEAPEATAFHNSMTGYNNNVLNEE